ncbi:MAG: TetR/AcrR family transcriptional regulator [Clostridia bacterium]|nr:TetR/AcrR family transcriptional regulator [Clostridia bacterium]
MRKGDIKKQAIIDTAERLFYRDGYAGTSVDGILAELKGSKGCFYHHFESKLAVLQTLCAQRAVHARTVFDQVKTNKSSIVERLNILLYCALPIRSGEEKFAALLLPMMLTSEGTILCAEYSRSLTEAFEDALSLILSEGEADESFYTDAPAGMARILLTLLNAFWREAAMAAVRGVSQRGGLDINDILPVLDLYRGAMERLIQAPFGSVDIIRAAEMMPLLLKATNQF